MATTLKALSALLAYPSADLLAALPEIAAIVAREPKLPRARREALAALADSLAAADLLDAQETYVALFDRGRATSLHLFEHVHGDSRERGQAMVDLGAVYARAGFGIKGGELPDFLPAVLEYLAERPSPEAKEMLGDCAHILRAVGEALQDRGSGYAAVLAALLALVGEAGLAAPRKQATPPKETPIDYAWVEEPVIFGPGGCGGGQGSAAPGAHPGFRSARPGLHARCDSHAEAGLQGGRPPQAVVNFTPRRA
jgi:nitrate reductase delta subunit